MAARDLFERLGDKIAGTRPQPEGAWAQGSEPPTLAPLGGTREQAVQRLQVGLTGRCAMILMVGVARVLGGQADIAEDAAVPDAAPTTEPSPATAQRDPLADAGVKLLGTSADAIARAIHFAIGQPADVDVNEMIVRPAKQAL